MARRASIGFERSATGGPGNEWSLGSGAGACSIDTTVPRSGNNCGEISGLSSGTRAGWMLQYSNTAVTTEHWFRFYFRPETAPTAENRIFSLPNGNTLASAPMVYMTIDSGRLLRLYDEDGQVGSASSALTLNQWVCVEVHVNRSGAGGSHVVEARLDQAAAFASASNRNLTNGFRCVIVGGNLNAEAQTTGVWYFDDIAFNDANTDYNNSWCGAGSVISLVPNGTLNLGTWTVTGAATAHEALDDLPYDSDTSYITSNTNSDVVELSLLDTPAELKEFDRVNSVEAWCVFSGINATDGQNASFFLRLRQFAGAAAAELTTGSATVPPNNTYKLNSRTGNTDIPTLIIQDAPGQTNLPVTKAMLDAMTVDVAIFLADTVGSKITSLHVTIDYTPEPLSDDIDEVTVVPAASDDDAFESSGTVTLADTSVLLDTTDHYAAFRGVANVPQGSTIYQAWIEMDIIASGSDEPLHEIWLEDVDDAAAYTTAANDISTRARTTATLTWDTADLGAATLTRHRSPMITTLVQEVTDRAGFASGNHIGVIIRGSANSARDLGWATWDHATALPPSLVIRFIPPAGAVAVGIEADAIWTVRALVALEESAVWNARAVVAKSGQLIHTVRETIEAEREAVWNVRALAGAERDALWSIRAPVGVDGQIVSDQRAVVAVAGDVLWHDREVIPAIRALAWKVREAVALSGTLDWHVRIVAALAQDLLWDARGAVALDGPVVFNVRAPVGTDGELLWDVLSVASVSINGVLRWNVRAPVAGVVQIIFNDREIVNADRELSWDQRVVAGAQREAAWNVREAVALAESIIYNVRETVAAERELAWAILALAGVAREGLWSVREAVGIDGELLWDQLSATAVALTGALRWDIRAAVAAERELRYNARAFARADRGILYGTRERVSTQRLLDWHVRNVTGVEGLLVWSARSRAAKEQIIRWNVAALTGLAPAAISIEIIELSGISIEVIRLDAESEVALSVEG